MGQTSTELQQDYTHLLDYRYERKFLVEELSSSQVLLIVKLHPLLFYTSYPPRYVNNLYLDTPDLENYHDNIAGASRRRKVRLRWYGELFGEVTQPRLEFKVRDGTVGMKHTYLMAPVYLDSAFCKRTLDRTAGLSHLPENVRYDLRDLELVLLNRYHRCYYASRNGRFRLTVDTCLSYYRANGILSNSFIHNQACGQEVVVELKYAVEQEAQADRAAGFFPFRMTRNSKYVQGLERVYF